MKACQLFLFGTDKRPLQNGGLEDRFRAFARTGDATEDIDKIRVGLPGSPSVADYLLNERSLIAELKLLKADPSSSIEKRVRAALTDAKVSVYGQYGLGAILRRIPGGDQIAKELLHVQGRRVRSELKAAAEQIASTREVFGTQDAAGMVVFLSDTSRLMDATSIAYAIRDVLEGDQGVTNGIHYVVVLIESHSIKLPNGQDGYPVLVVKDALQIRPEPEQRFVASMIDYWATWHGRELFFIDHNGSWDALGAIEPVPAIRAQ